MWKKLIIIFFTISCLPGFSQEESMSAGVRLGGSTGICFTYFEGYHGFEGLLSRRNKGIQLTGIYLVQKPLENKYRLNFWVYYGAGLHVGYVRWKQRIGPHFANKTRDDWYWKHNMVVGADGKFGIEYRFLSVPLIFGVDYKPFFELFGKQIFRVNLWDFGFSIKYVLK